LEKLRKNLNYLRNWFSESKRKKATSGNWTTVVEWIRRRIK